MTLSNFYDEARKSFLLFIVGAENHRKMYVRFNLIYNPNKKSKHMILNNKSYIKIVCIRRKILICIFDFRIWLSIRLLYIYLWVFKVFNFVFYIRFIKLYVCKKAWTLIHADGNHSDIKYWNCSVRQLYFRAI